jgi:GTP-binding protein EngB required for normal cell division
MSEENVIPFKNEYEKMIYQKKKIEEQDDLIDNMIALNKENKQLGKEMTSNLRNQNIQIENINSDMDKVGSSMNKTTNRFERYLEKTSYCKLYLIIFLQAAIILYLLL